MWRGFLKQHIDPRFEDKTAFREAAGRSSDSDSHAAVDAPVDLADRTLVGTG